MKSAVAGVVTLLNSGTSLVFADLYTFTLNGGSVLRYTSADRLVQVGGNSFLVGPLLKRSNLSSVVGVEVDELRLELSASDSVQVNGKPMMAFIAGGGLDGARLLLERGFSQNWSTAFAGSVIKFGGRVADIEMDRHGASITVNSDFELLDTPVPSNVYQPQCMNALYDTGCGLNRAALTVSNAVTASPTPTRYKFDSTLAQAGGYFDLGGITFTSGANNGVSRTVKKFTSGGLIEPVMPFPFDPAAGDTFTIYPGCERTQSACSTKFANLIRFRGAPYIPVPETVL